VSIIYDALKKVENANKDTQQLPQAEIPAPAAVIEQPAAVAATKPDKDTRLPPIVVLVCLAVFTAYVLLPIQRKHTVSSKNAALPSRVFTGSVELVLNGVFFSGPDAYGLINNQIVKVGDQIAGATVKKITVTDVELETADAKVIKLFTPG
jgi:hypothetical protein